MKIIDEKDIIIPQEKMSLNVFVVSIIIMMTVQYMTLDMYLPALPVLKDAFHSSEAALNVSLNAYLFLFAIGSLVGGTISDKYGRRPIMLAGLWIAVGSLLLSAFSQGVIFLSLMRGLCGLGGGIYLTVAAAIIRDSFDGNTFQTITTITQATAVIGPIFAPACGAFLIEYLSWRWIFLVLCAATLLTMIPFFFFKETWPKERRHVNSIWAATLQPFALVKDKDYVLFIILVMLLGFPLWAYLAVCTYIFYDDFGVSNMEYSVLYAIGSVSAVLAPFLYIWLSRKRGDRTVINSSFLLLLISAAMLFTIAGVNAIWFLIASIPVLMVEAIVKAQSMVIILDEHPNEAGSASSLTAFLLNLTTVFGTSAATLPWKSFLFGFAVITAISTLIALVFWIIILKKKVYSNHF